MRVMRPLLALIFLSVGAVLGWLNQGAVTVDLGPFSAHSTLGISLLVALLIGAVTGGATVWLGRFGTTRRVPAAGRTDNRPEG